MIGNEEKNLSIKKSVLTPFLNEITYKRQEKLLIFSFISYIMLISPGLAEQLTGKEISNLNIDSVVVLMMSMTAYYLVMFCTNCYNDWRIFREVKKGPFGDLSSTLERAVTQLGSLKEPPFPHGINAKLVETSEQRMQAADKTIADVEAVVKAMEGRDEQEIEAAKERFLERKQERVEYSNEVKQKSREAISEGTEDLAEWWSKTTATTETALEALGRIAEGAAVINTYRTTSSILIGVEVVFHVLFGAGALFACVWFLL